MRHQVINCYLTAATAPALFSPDDLASLQAWYDADFHSGAADSAVDPILDRMGTYDAPNTGAGADPILRHNSLNGLKQIEFQGGAAGKQSQMTVHQDLNLMEGATEGCFFAVVTLAADPPASTDVGAILDNFGSAGTHYPYLDGNIYDGFGSTTRKTTSNPAMSLASPRIYSAHSAAGNWRNFIDGTLHFSTATNTVSFNNVGRRIGFNSANNYLKGFIAEILIFNDAMLASDTDRQKVEGYLAHRWGLAANLPSGHPYESVAP